MSQYRRTRRNPGYTPGQQLSCGANLTRGNVVRGCPQVLEITINNPGAVAGDYIQLDLKGNFGCGGRGAYSNNLNHLHNTGACGALRFRYVVDEEGIWSPEAAATKFEEMLRQDLRFNQIVDFQRDGTDSFKLIAREDCYILNLEDQSEGFTVTITETVTPMPDSTIFFGHMVWLDDCRDVHYPSETEPFFAGFVVQCQPLYERCGDSPNEQPRYYNCVGETVHIQQNKGEPIVVVTSNIPAPGQSRLAFDPTNPPGVPVALSFGDPAPAGGFFLEGWQILTSYRNLSTVIRQNS